jgi:hypothetical protein
LLVPAKGQTLPFYPVDLNGLPHQLNIQMTPRSAFLMFAAIPFMFLAYRLLSPDLFLSRKKRTAQSNSFDLLLTCLHNRPNPFFLKKAFCFQNPFATIDRPQSIDFRRHLLFERHFKRKKTILSISLSILIYNHRHLIVMTTKRTLDSRSSSLSSYPKYQHQSTYPKLKSIGSLKMQ